MKKILALVACLSLVASLAVGGSIAYLQDQDSRANVMALGNVKIEQIEQERDENGKLVDFHDAKPAYPAVGPIEWDENNFVEVNGTGYKVFVPELKNVVDKIVTVNNIGKSEAFIRTIVAIEAPDYDPNDLIHYNYNNTGVKQGDFVMTEIDGVKYVVVPFTYEAPLAAGAKSAPSLMQLFLDSKTTNEDVAKFDEYWDVLVLSQAVQTAGFEDAKTALDTAFGEITEDNIKKWFADVEAASIWSGEADTEWYDAAATEFTLNTAEDLAGLAELVNDGGVDFTGKTIKLEADIDLNSKPWTPISNWDSAFSGTFDGQGHTISNLVIEDGNDYAGLFSITVDSTIQNINVKNADVKATEMAAGIVAYPLNSNISDCHVSGDINIVCTDGYAAGIAGINDYGETLVIEDCSVIADGTGVIKSEKVNGVAGIIGWTRGNVTISGCDVKNLELTAKANVGSIAGYLCKNGIIDSCTVENVVLNKTQTDIYPSIGLAAGGYTYDASKPITIKNSSFNNVTLNATSKAYTFNGEDKFLLLHGSEYDGSAEASCVAENNTIKTETIVDNRKTN